MTSCHAQSLHLAHHLFPLDDILIPSRLMAPPPYGDSQIKPFIDEIIHKTIPYLPDWPELTAQYCAPTLTLAQAMQR